MIDQNHEKTEYMSVGEIAEKAGVTIRTLQYYDQKGLLTPSVKGTRNQRFYTDKDMEKLYRILCYKFMGLSLKEIQEQMEKEHDPDRFANTLRQQISEAETAISEQIKRYAVLKDLEALDNKLNDASWADYADIVDYINNKWEMIWQLNLIYESNSSKLEEPRFGSDEMKRYYKLIADAASLKNKGVPPTDDSVVDLIKEYYTLKEISISNGTWETKQEIIKIDTDNFKTAFNEIADFWIDIKTYLRTASDEYLKRREEDK